MAKIKDSEHYLFATELWHRKILEFDAKPKWFAKHLPFSKKKREARTCNDEDPISK
jgi:hypothetical protein